jgi:F-type H+-transporting ATPase subunit b
MINIDLTLVASIINFFVLVWLLQKVLYKPVVKLLEERKKNVEDKLAAAQRKEEQATAKEQEYQRHLVESKNEVQQALKRAARQGDAMKEEIIAQAQAKAQEIIARAQKQAQEEQLKMWHQFQEDLGRLALNLAKKVVGQLDEQHYQTMMDNLISQLDPSVLEEKQ